MLPIQKMISKYNNSSRGGQRIKYLIFHYTGNKGDTAENNAEHFNKGDKGASAHYFVSDKEIYQVVEDDRAAWAVGDGNGKYGITNSNSINVEMCCWIDGTVSEKTEKNAIELGKYLMKKHGISINNVVRHYDASRKVCPNWSSNNWSRWTKFKNKLVDNFEESKPEIKEESKLLKECKKQVLNYGDKGTYVYLAQSAMKALGLYNGTIDGQYGPSKGSNSFYKAVINLNAKLGFPNDSRLGPACWEFILTK
ncbi:peptidoglycan recognition protein family protein [Clostridium paraputrificum]|uniref:peptidoglycan recognition protein family protein n=1 Tax=Clostridium paraputrificum TaxID=29363 RepID=UPI0012B9AAED|nr:N-acetylmuramoyl-L-alanine amidase [Clostridium paraputrificum]